MEDHIEKAFNLKRKFFDDGNTQSYTFRIKQLKNLKKMIKDNEEAIMDALYQDLRKPKFEAFTAEIGVLHEEINIAIKNLKKWMKPQKVATPLSLQPASSNIYPVPLGVVLIIGPWNYPFQLLIAPLIGAIAAGNCSLLKPSDQSRHTSNLVSRLIAETFPEAYISVVEGPGALVGPKLIDRFRFDHIFFTGSPSVGSKVAEMAARHLTPVTLELGGKSPAIVTEDANVDIAAKRICWAKFFNAGQTCVSPDYVVINENRKEEFILKVKHYIRSFFGSNPIDSDSYGRIINKKRYSQLLSYLEEGTILIGGDVKEEEFYIGPTIMDNIDLNDRVMKEEIFGPILPIITYKDIKDVVEIVRRNRYPLALYLYTNNKKTEEYIINHIEFGGGCINNGLIHVVNTHLPFGGVGFSGMGRYHGKYSFDLFSHKKSIIKTKSSLEPSLKYAPYHEKKLKLVKKLLK